MRFYIALSIRLLILIMCFSYYKIKHKKLLIFFIFLGCFIAGHLCQPLAYNYKTLDMLIQITSVFTVLLFTYKKNERK